MTFDVKIIIRRAIRTFYSNRRFASRALIFLDCRQKRFRDIQYIICTYNITRFDHYFHGEFRHIFNLQKLSTPSENIFTFSVFNSFRKRDVAPKRTKVCIVFALQLESFLKAHTPLEMRYAYILCGYMFCIPSLYTFTSHLFPGPFPSDHRSANAGRHYFSAKFFAKEIQPTRVMFRRLLCIGCAELIDCNAYIISMCRLQPYFVEDMKYTVQENTRTMYSQK